MTKLAQTGDVVKHTVLTALGLFSLVTLIRGIRRRSQPGEDVPYAPGWLPWLGHIWSLRKYMKDNDKLLLGRWGMDVYEKQKLDIFAGLCFGLTFLVVNDPDLAQEVCSDDPHRFTKDMRNMPNGDLAFKLFGNGLFFAATDDPKWQIAHNILKTPFSTKGIKLMMPLMCDQADALVQTLKREVGYGKATYIDAWVTKMAFETIAVCGLSTSLGCFKDDQQHPWISAFNDAVDFCSQLQFCPKALRPLLLRGWPRFNAANEYMHSFCTEIIRKRQEQTEQSEQGAGDAGDRRRDLLDMMLHDKDPKTGRAMTEDMIVDNVLTFLFAGQDSTAASMASCLCFLCAVPRCKAKLLKEIDEVVGTGWEHLSQMPYLDWCIKETMRLVPPAVAIVRQTRGDQLLGKKWRIPNGTPVIVNVMGMHYSKALWGEDAAQFRPERWEHGAPHRFAFIPFALGPRACTGREFAVVEQKITMVKFFQHFDLRRPLTAVEPQPGYTTVKSAEAKFPPFINMDVEFKQNSAFVGMFSSFELLERLKQ